MPTVCNHAWRKSTPPAPVLLRRLVSRSYLDCAPPANAHADRARPVAGHEHGRHGAVRLVGVGDDVTPEVVEAGRVVDNAVQHHRTHRVRKDVAVHRADGRAVGDAEVVQLRVVERHAQPVQVAHVLHRRHVRQQGRAGVARSPLTVAGRGQGVGRTQGAVQFLRGARRAVGAIASSRRVAGLVGGRAPQRRGALTDAARVPGHQVEVAFDLRGRRSSPSRRRARCRCRNRRVRRD